MNAIRNVISNSFIGCLKRKYQLNKFKKFWIKNNSFNNTIPNNIFNFSLVEVGKASYGKLNIITFSEKQKLYIGNYVSIAERVLFLLNAEHEINYISTYPFKVKALRSIKSEAFSKGDIIIDDDVWIGDSAKILSGVHIGQGAVIAAGAVVSKNVPPYAIVGGVPAKIIKYRFSADMIKELLKIDYSKLTKEMIIEHENELYTKLTKVEQLEWMPKK